MGQGMEESVPLGEVPAQALLLPSPLLSCLCGSRNRQPWASTAIRRAGSRGRASMSESRPRHSPTSACCWLQLSEDVHRTRFLTEPLQSPGIGHKEHMAHTFCMLSQQSIQASFHKSKNFYYQSILVWTKYPGASPL